MNKNLLDKVSAEKLDALLDALCEVISDMRGAEPEKEKRYRDEAYTTWKSHTNLTHPVKVF